MAGCSSSSGYTHYVEDVRGTGKQTRHNLDLHRTCPSTSERPRYDHSIKSHNYSQSEQKSLKHVKLGGGAGE